MNIIMAKILHSFIRAADYAEIVSVVNPYITGGIVTKFAESRDLPKK